ncbi:MAG: hypothetical protein M1828_004310 [Chrysothrix sp. TS-e1954]|nr:MAG: hypothetical protein M1828_004310 [Chrysothrix sp. TS-e1954]
MSVMASYLLDCAYSLTNCLSCFPSSPSLKLNGRSFKILRLLGEGGFSYVYLVSSSSSSGSTTLHALKKIRCPFGAESVANALREVEAYALFPNNPHIIQALDHAVVSDSRGGGLSQIGDGGGGGGGGGGEAGSKTVYILLPYYERGNLQDAINADLVNRTRMGERRLLRLMSGVCEALRAMHQYRVPSADVAGEGRRGVREARRVEEEARMADEEAEEEAEDAFEEEGLNSQGEVAANSSRRRRRRRRRVGGGGGREEDDGEEEEAPLMDDEITTSQVGVAPGQVRAYAHRDIKPGNIMISTHSSPSPSSSSSGTPILMDLGSLAPSPTPIPNRSAALALADQAAENSTLPYRAPELFDPKTGGSVDTKVDIWSLGCTMYACLVGKSPFERRSEETGGSLTMCILGGDWKFPGEQRQEEEDGKGGKKKPQRRQTGGQAGGEGGREERVVSPMVQEIVTRCLMVEPAERPDVDELKGMIEKAIKELPRGHGGDDDDDDEEGDA